MTDDVRYSLRDLSEARGIVEEHFDRAMRSVGLDPEDAADLPLAGEAEYTRALWKALSALEGVVCRSDDRRLWLSRTRGRTS